MHNKLLKSNLTNKKKRNGVSVILLNGVSRIDINQLARIFDMLLTQLDMPSVIFKILTAKSIDKSASLFSAIMITSIVKV